MKKFREFLLESEDLKDLMRDLENLGYEEMESVGISGKMVEDFGEGARKWRITSAGKGASKEQALLRAISAAIESIESGGGKALLRMSGEIEISHTVLQKAIRDKRIGVEEIDYGSFTDGYLVVGDLPLQTSWSKDVVGVGYAERIQEWE